MTTHTRRLVRNKALETWRVPGAEHQVRPYRSTAELQSLLMEKLEEETREVLSATTIHNLTEELGDVLAVLQAIAYANEIPWKDVITTEIRKTLKSGSFIEPLVWDQGL